MTYLVTGGCGFIGSHLVDALVAAGHRVTVLDDLSTGLVGNLAPGATLVEGCVTDAAVVARAMEGARGVFHLAAIASVARANEAWLETHRVNLAGTVAVLEAAARAGQIPVVYASSAAVYGAQATLPLAEDVPPVPLTAYGADKLGSELHGRVAAQIHGLGTVGLRFFNVYGPRQQPGSPYSGVISIFADRVRRGLPITLHGDGSQTRDFVYVGDVVSALRLAMDHCHRAKSPVAEVANVCTGRATSIADLAEQLMTAAGRRVVVDTTASRPGDIPASVGDPRRALALFGFRAATPLADGLAALLAALAVAEGGSETNA
jgi:UDP-glucose 4-epimerase